MEDVPLKIITLKNSKGVELVVSNYGATILSLKVPDKNNRPVNVVVGLNQAHSYTKVEYQNHQLYLGSIVGRYAGRISKGHIEIEGQKYPLYEQKGVHLHGGKQGFDKRYWIVEKTDPQSVTLAYKSRHLEEGYPGNLQVKVRYEVLESNSLKITTTATTDKLTVVNLTNHSYFNLNGFGTILDHWLQIHSDSYLEVDSQILPTGQVLDTKNTPFDYTAMSQLKKPAFKGLDDTFVLQESKWAANLSSEKSGISMKVYTDQPAMVVYTPKSLPNLNYANKGGFDEFPAICFETQNFPDAPHHQHFPTSELRPDENYKNVTTFEFSVRPMN